jgi:AAA family ATP:ADP antiporter
MLCAGAVMAQFVSAKATRDALFLASLGLGALPTMLIVTAVVSILFVALQARWATRISPPAQLQILFAVSGMLFLCEWVAGFYARPATAVLLYLHTSAVGPVLLSGFWLMATDQFDPTTAKRRFGQIGGAGTFGGMLGALVSERIAATVGAPAMLLVLAGSQFVLVWLMSVLARSAYTPATQGHGGPVPLGPGARSDLRTVMKAPHLRYLAVLILLGTTSAALLDYLFKAKAVEALGAGDQLLRFFALYYAATSLLTFILQIASSRAALDRFGVGLTTGTPSIALLAGSIGALFAPGFGSLIAARAGESVFRGSWFRAGYELFYTPIAPAEKRAVKSVIDVGVERLGDAMGGGIVRAVVLLAPAAQSSVLLWLAAAGSALAVLAASRLNAWYVRALGKSLVSQAPQLAEADTLHDTTRGVLLGVRKATAQQERTLAPDQAAANDVMRLRSRDRERVIQVLSRSEGLSAELVAHTIPMLAVDAVADYAMFALRKVAEERIGQLTDALIDPNQDYAVRRRLARVFTVCVSQRAADGLMLALDDARFDVRFHVARSLAAIRDRNPRVRVDHERVLDVVMREVTVGRPVWESRRLLEPLPNESPLDAFVRDRAGRSLAHVFTLLSLILPAEPLQIAFRSLHSEDTRLRGTALEYLDEVLPPLVREGLWPFLVEGRAKRPSPPPSHDQVIANLLRSNPSLTIQGLAR